MKLPKKKALLIPVLIMAFLLANFETSPAALPFQPTLERWGLEVRILPHSPLYPLKTSWENLQLFLRTPTKVKKAQLLLKFCDIRLKELSQVITISNPPAEEQYQTLKRYRQHFEQFQQIHNSLNEGGLELGQLLQKHLERRAIFQQILEKNQKNLGSFWTNEISYQLKLEKETPAPQRHHFSHRSQSDRQVLGTQTKRGLELHPLKE